jgi:hypothetical protein
MSIHTISTVLRKQWGNASRKMVAIKLADVSDDVGARIYPSIRTIADEAELSERQAQRIIGEFREAGLLQVVKQGGNGPGSTTEYHFDMEVVAKLPDAAPKGDKVTPLKDDTVTPSEPIRVTSTTKKGGTHVTQPFSEPLDSPYGEHSASVEAGADAPSVSAMAWKEALELLSSSALPEPKKRSLIGLWLKRAPSDEGKEKFRAIVAAAKRAGTGDPVAYITKAMDREFPPPPDPKKFQAADWEPRVQSAISFGKWSPQWGPAPGKRGCLIPPEMISQQLVSALATVARR